MANTELPSVSVVIPVFNEEFYIARCLESLKKQNYDGQFEIIVADNGSTDKTLEVVKPFDVRVAIEPERGISRALNAGSLAAKGDILVFTDADTILPPDWLSSIVAHFEKRPELVALGGPYIFHDVSETINFMVKNVAIPIHEKFMRKYLNQYGCACVNLAVRKDAYEKIGGFNPSIQWGQENELFERLAGVGEVYFDPSLLVSTSFRRYDGGYDNVSAKTLNALKELCVQLYRYYHVVYQKSYSLDAQKPIRANVKEDKKS